MFEKVLFPTDFSERADIMLDCVAGMPQVKEVVLLHVVKETSYPMGADIIDTLAKQKSEETLAQAEHYLKSLNPAIKVTLETTVAPDITDGILAAAEKSGADLIVITAHPKGARGGVLLGSVPSTLLCRPGRAGILFMRHRIVESLSGTTYEKYCPMLFSRVLCPTDFSRFSDHATSYAGSIAGVGEVILLNVVPETGAAHETADAVKASEAWIAALCDTLAAKGIRCRAMVKTGSPAGEIVSAADEEDVSLICISSCGKGCLRDFLLGSTVQDVAMNAKRPVLVVRSQE